MPPTTNELILEKVEKILRILAAIATQGLKQREQIALLDKAGLEPKAIADLLGTSANTVRVELVRIRRIKGTKKARRNSK